MRKAFDQDVVKTWGISRDHNLRQEWQGTIESLIDEYAKVKEADADDKRSKDSSSSPVKPADPPLPALKRTSPEKVTSPPVPTSAEPLATQLPDHPVEQIEAGPTSHAGGDSSFISTSAKTIETSTNGQKAMSKSPEQEPLEEDRASASAQGFLFVSPSADGEEDISDTSSEITASRQSASSENSASGPLTKTIRRDINTVYNDLDFGALVKPSNVPDPRRADHTRRSPDTSSPVLPPPIPEEVDELEGHSDDEEGDIELGAHPADYHRPGTPLPGHIASSADPAIDGAMTDNDYKVMSQELLQPQVPAPEVVHVPIVSSNVRSSSPTTSAPASAVTLRFDSSPVMQQSTPTPADPHGKAGPKGGVPPWMLNQPGAKVQAVTVPTGPKPTNPKVTEPRRSRAIRDGELNGPTQKADQYTESNRDMSPIHVEDDSDSEKGESSKRSSHKRRQPPRDLSPNKAAKSSPRAAQDVTSSGISSSPSVGLFASQRRGSNVTTYQSQSPRNQIDLGGRHMFFQKNSPKPPLIVTGAASSSNPMRQDSLTPSKNTRHPTSIPTGRATHPSSDHDDGGSSSLRRPHSHEESPRLTETVLGGREKRKNRSITTDADDSSEPKKLRSEPTPRQSSAGRGSTRNNAIDIEDDGDVHER